MLIKGNYKVLCASSSVFQLLPVLKDWFQICPKTDFQVPTMLEKRAPYLRTLSLAGIRETCRDGGPCCCLLIPSCAGRASWGGVHLGCFNGAVDAVSASVLDVLLNSFILSDPATLHTLPFRFSDPDKLGWVVCSGVFLLGWFYVGLGFFFPFSLALFLHENALNSMDTLKDWFEGVLCSGHGSDSLLGFFWPYTFTPLSFFMYS